MKPKKHDHRGSCWIIANGRLLWCYQCGAWTYNVPAAEKKAMGGPAWYRTTGLGGLWSEWPTIRGTAMSKPKRGRAEQAKETR